MEFEQNWLQNHTTRDPALRGTISLTGLCLEKAGRRQLPLGRVNIDLKLNPEIVCWALRWVLIFAHLCRVTRCPKTCPMVFNCGAIGLFTISHYCYCQEHCPLCTAERFEVSHAPNPSPVRSFISNRSQKRQKGARVAWVACSLCAVWGTTSSKSAALAVVALHIQKSIPGIQL